MTVPAAPEPIHCSVCGRIIAYVAYVYPKPSRGPAPGRKIVCTFCLDRGE